MPLQEYLGILTANINPWYTHTVWWGRMPWFFMIKQNKTQLLIPSSPALPVSLCSLLERTVNNCPLLQPFLKSHYFSSKSVPVKINNECMMLISINVSSLILLDLSNNNWCNGHSFPHEILSSLVLYETLLFHQVLCSNSFVVTLPLLNLRMTEFQGQVLDVHPCTYNPLHRRFYTVLSSNAIYVTVQQGHNMFRSSHTSRRVLWKEGYMRSKVTGRLRPESYTRIKNSDFIQESMENHRIFDQTKKDIKF